ncbi:MAG: 23S rRNA (guanosine(2251)-2'-O)-methyltransferase RlmB [Bacteroidales bacterium]|nr:23S rRNA (guanosine(2251)-2'-O)-methyltransferase RlmB [Bacteroidales bacterium]
MSKNKYIYGIRPVLEALMTGLEIEKIFIKQGFKDSSYREIRELADKREIPMQYVPSEKLNRLTSRNHQGIVAFISEIEYQEISDIIPVIFESGKIPLLIILDRITDVRNFGAIVRTAECSRVDAIIIPQGESAKINSDAMKTSAGALAKITICRVSNLIKTTKYLKDCGIKIVACSERAGKVYYNANFKDPLAFVFGSEEKGISKDLLSLSDLQVKIEMFGSIESLNVSVATGIILFEAIRQRAVNNKQ